MFQILMAVLGVFLLATVMVAGISYVKLGAGQSLASVQMMSVGFQAWERAYAAFRIANRMQPMVSEDLVSFLPDGPLKAPNGLAYSFGRDASGPYICLSGETNSENDLTAMLRLGDGSSKVSAISSDLVSYGGACGATGPFVLGQSLAVTYRLSN